MASCITPQWSSSTKCPQAKLTVTIASQTATTATLNWVLEYIAGSAAETSVAKSYSVNIGDTYVSGTYNINGKTGTHTIKSGTLTVNKTSSASTVTFGVSFSFNLTWSGVYGGTKKASGSISIPAITTYKITYNANGGTGVPSNQTKTHGVDIKLSTTKPTRTGYTFLGWATSSSATTAGYSAGATYSGNANLTLYAVWKIITYTVTYNANGGTGVPSNQTKEYGKTLVLSSVKPTRDNYNFVGWASTSSNANSGLVEYSSGGNYTKNAAVTLYAVWEYAYVEPAIYNLVIHRCLKTGVISDEGTYMLLHFDWKSTYTVSTVNVKWVAAVSVNEPSLTDEPGDLPSDNGQTTFALDSPGTSGSVWNVVVDGDFSLDKSYTITVTIADSDGSTSAKRTLNGSVIPIDVKYGGKGASFGKPAELDDTVEFAWDAKFNNPVYGNVVGLNRLPEIGANDDFNNYMDTGCWAVYTNANAETIANMPVQVAGRLEVYSSTGEGIQLASWSYLRQKFTPHNVGNAVWERDLKRNTSNVWTYGDWHPSNLTPAAADKVYHNQKTLWTGASFMHTNSDGSLVTINLSEPVSKQANGIVLVFSEYKSSSPYEGFASFFVPKIIVNTSGISSLHSFTMMNNSFGLVCSKYLNIYDEYISGHASNNSTGTSNGITYANNKYVLRYVYGV